MKRLIVNSDDYGRTPEISRGIREAHLRGVVTTSTCMMNIPTTAHDIKVALADTPALGLGVHLVLTMGKPLVSHGTGSSLTDERGYFLKLAQLLEHLPTIEVEEVKEEWRAQIDAFIAEAGCKPTHLDSHHHSSYFSAELFHAMLELAEEYECAIRFPFTDPIAPELQATYPYVPDLMHEYHPPHPDRFIADFYDEGANHEQLVKILNQLEDGVSEVMCHPGYVDEAFAGESSYHRQREQELDILTDASLKEMIERNGIQLITFAELDRPVGAL